MALTLAALVLLPALAAAAAPLLRRLGAQLALLVGVAVLHLALTVLCWIRPAAPLGELLELDALGLLFLSVTSTLFLAVALQSIPTLLAERDHPGTALRRYVPCLLAFLAAMTLVTCTRHLALLWAAVEATTLASAPLIYFHRRASALEAAWKYLLLCSVGIAVALLGTFFVGVAAAALGETLPLTVSALTRAAARLEPSWLRVGFVLAVVGYGTKMGLAPMHTWLPDAHSQAPSPVSALLSGALLNTAFLGVLRFYQVCDAAGQGGFARSLLVTLGLVSLAVAAAFLVGQRDYKRLLAYSSVEHMGVLATGVGLGGGAAYGAMLHATNHSLAKAGLFLVAGNVLGAYGSTRAADVRGAARRLPVSGVLLVAGLLAVGGAPPFGPFVSELVVFRAAVAHHVWLGALFALLLGIAFLGMASVLLPMAQGRADGPPVRERVLAVLPPVVLMAGVLVLGMWVPRFLDGALARAAALVGGAS